ncbi:type 1 glutamine amidotransferase domain-containing protein [Agrobacterium sp. SOY23]|uniref:type 1 glutamine amidotransferase domain-containing protein n=1 Tax=Agrobacterium sp. SOY23 TaxID=3014555 RepID=UPI0022B05555|nr:type 1 glutamine amidotransferase domain-containing protein [Agrobacterium sp. SOY23]MCZ4431289.1 type 1 glutamine amidotransferase domain-containing protein [Agrobacterium sp. SOY23]
MAKILFVTTSHDRMLDGERTGLWLDEFTIPYLAFTSAGHAVTVSSVAGGLVPIDPRSEPTASQVATWALAIEGLDATPAFHVLYADKFDAVFIPGGHGTMFDMPYNRALHALLFSFEASGRVIAAICHAPAAFTGMRRPDGTPFVKDRTLAAYTDSEERAGQHAANVPFLLEERLRGLGARQVIGNDFEPNAVTDGRLVTGQNPQSSAAVATHVMKLL